MSGSGQQDARVRHDQSREFAYIGHEDTAFLRLLELYEIAVDIRVRLLTLARSFLNKKRLRMAASLKKMARHSSDLPRSSLKGGVGPCAVFYLLFAALALLLHTAPASAKVLCNYWGKERLLIAPELGGSRLILEPNGPVEPMPPYSVRNDRPVAHRTFVLAATDSRAEGDLDLYLGCEPGECVLAPSEVRRPFQVPVFFIGRPGQSYADFLRGVENFGFGPSWRVRPFLDFSEAQFTLERGPGYFDDFRPRFQCGLPGIMVCARNCPPRSGSLWRSLVDWTLSGQKWTPPAAEPRRKQSTRVPEQAAKGREPLDEALPAPSEREPAQRTKPPVPERRLAEDGKPVPTPAQPRPTEKPKPAPSPAPGPPKPAPAPATPATPSAPAQKPTVPGRQPEQTPAPAPQPAPSAAPAPAKPAPAPATPAAPPPAPNTIPKPAPGQPAPQPKPAAPAPAQAPQAAPKEKQQTPPPAAPAPQTAPPPSAPPPAAGADSLSVRIFSSEALQSGQTAPALANLQIRAQVSCEVADSASFVPLASGEGAVPFDRTEAERSRRLCLIIKRDTPLGRACLVLPYVPGKVVAPLEQFSEAHCTGRDRLSLVIETESGAPLSAETVLLAEGKLAFAGAEFAISGDELVATLPIGSFRKAVAGTGLKDSFRQHRLVRQEFEDGKLTLTLQPLYIRLSDLNLRIVDSTGRPAQGCSLRLDVAQNRRLGGGWDAAEAQGGLDLTPSGRSYRVASTSAIDPTRLLIGTAADGAAATLTSTNAACPLSQGPEVTAAELRAGSVTRSLKPAGPVFIAMVSADRGLAAGLPADSIEGYWASALGLIEETAKGPWETEILSWTQAPGRLATEVWRSVTGNGPLFTNAEQKTGYARVLSDLSKEQAVPTRNVQAIIDRQLPRAVEDVRHLSGVRPPDVNPREHLILVSGTLQQSTSDFCREAAAGDGLRGALSDIRLRRAVVIELWSQSAVNAMQDVTESVAGAPGLYRCKIPGALGETLKVYGIAVPAGLGAAERQRVFDALQKDAERFFAPAS